MFSNKDSLKTAKAVLDNCNEAKDAARYTVNHILLEIKNETVILDNPAFILVDYGDGNRTERAIRAVKMNCDEVIHLSETPMMGFAVDIVWEEDDTHININWPSLLEALIRALSKKEVPAPQKHSYSANITLRIDCESDRELSGEDIADLVGNLDYEFISRTRGIDIVSTEICGVD